MSTSNERIDALDPVVAAAARELRRPVRLGQSLDDRVMAAIIAEPPAWTRGGPADDLPDGVESPPLRVVRGGGGRAGTAWRWLSRPQTLRLSPLAGLAAAAGFAAMVLVGSQRIGGAPAGDGPEQLADGAPVILPGVPAQAPDTVQVVQFVFVAPEARQVALVGDFNDWDAEATPLQVQGGEMWTVEIPLEPGRHRYAFIVDGEELVADPQAPRAPGGFGAPSSVVTVANRMM